MASEVKAWLRRHRKAERQLTKVLGKFFRDQNARIMRAMGERPSAVLAALAINQEAERAQMLKMVGPMLNNLMGMGASAVLARRPPRRTKSAAPDGQSGLEAFELPQWVQDEIAKAFQSLEAQTYWQTIQAGTQEQVAKLVSEGIKDGLSMPLFKKRLLKQCNELSEIRAAAIARTETTLAFNAGHDAGYRYLANQGDEFQVEWLTIVDPDTRPAHVEANHQTIPAGGQFTIAGYQTPYPGHWSLPAAQRVNCRCTTAAILS